MAKSGSRSSESRNVAGNAGGGGQATSTHPATRTIDAGRAGQAGAVKAAPVPVPSIADCESRRQKPKNDDQPCSLTNLPTNESNESSLQHPVGPDVAVPTKH